MKTYATLILLFGVVLVKALPTSQSLKSTSQLKNWTVDNRFLSKLGNDSVDEIKQGNRTKKSIICVDIQAPEGCPPGCGEHGYPSPPTFIHSPPSGGFLRPPSDWPPQIGYQPTPPPPPPPSQDDDYGSGSDESDMPPAPPQVVYQPALPAPVTRPPAPPQIVYPPSHPPPSQVVYQPAPPAPVMRPPAPPQIVYQPAPPPPMMMLPAPPQIVYQPAPPPPMMMPPAPPQIVYQPAPPPPVMRPPAPPQIVYQPAPSPPVMRPPAPPQVVYQPAPSPPVMRPPAPPQVVYQPAPPPPMMMPQLPPLLPPPPPPQVHLPNMRPPQLAGPIPQLPPCPPEEQYVIPGGDSREIISYEILPVLHRIPSHPDVVITTERPPYPCLPPGAPQPLPPQQSASSMTTVQQQSTVNQVQVVQANAYASGNHNYPSGNIYQQPSSSSSNLHYQNQWPSGGTQGSHSSPNVHIMPLPPSKPSHSQDYPMGSGSSNLDNAGYGSANQQPQYGGPISFGQSAGSQQTGYQPMVMSSGQIVDCAQVQPVASGAYGYQSSQSSVAQSYAAAQGAYSGYGLASFRSAQDADGATNSTIPQLYQTNNSHNHGLTTPSSRYSSSGRNYFHQKRDVTKKETEEKIKV